MSEKHTSLHGCQTLGTIADKSRSSGSTKGNVSSVVSVSSVSSTVFSGSSEGLAGGADFFFFDFIFDEEDEAFLPSLRPMAKVVRATNNCTKAIQETI